MANESKFKIISTEADRFVMEAITRNLPGETEEKDENYPSE